MPELYELGVIHKLRNRGEGGLPKRLQYYIRGVWPNDYSITWGWSGKMITVLQF